MYYRNDTIDDGDDDDAYVLCLIMGIVVQAYNGIFYNQNNEFSSIEYTGRFYTE